jgi:glycosyltransferase involved in cell wall biosynthesis
MSASATATWYVVTGNSDYYWRVEAPARAVGGAVTRIPEVGGFYAITQPNLDSAFRWTQDEQGRTAYPDHQGAAVWTRPDGPRALHAMAMRKLHGVFTVAETDDNYLSPKHFNVHMRSNWKDEKPREQHLKAMMCVDRIVCSTPRLRDEYWRGLKERFGKPLPDFAVCRNHVFTGDWPQRIERDGPVRVGWMGSPSHVWDVKLVWPALRWAFENGAETWMIGYDPASETEHEITSEKAKHDARQWRKAGYKHMGWRKLNGTERMALPLDIGLCPLQTNRFTLGKSDVKAIEYTIAGAAVIAQSNGVYGDWVHGETCLLAGSRQDWIRAVERLMRDDGLRERLVANAQQYVRECRSEKQLREEWGGAISH